MVDLALDHLVGRGRRRVATLCTIGVHQELGAYLRNAMRARGIEVVERWQQIVPHDVPDAVRNNVLLLMAGADRPDALFIADDNLVEAASGGLVAAGVSVPGGFETMKTLETAIGVIDQQRQGQRVASVTRVPAVLEPSPAQSSSS
jgi:DNA-binding LacI/PurR family transcriptional regulator